MDKYQNEDTESLNLSNFNDDSKDVHIEDITNITNDKMIEEEASEFNSLDKVVYESNVRKDHSPTPNLDKTDPGLQQLKEESNEGD